MSERRKNPELPPYPLLSDPETPLAAEQAYSWGSLHITRGVSEAYGLQIRLPDTAAAQTDEPQEVMAGLTNKYTTDILIAAPDELEVDGFASTADGRVGVTFSPKGSRITIGLTQDKDLLGISLTSKAIEQVTSQINPDEVRAFLSSQGLDMHDSLQQQIPLFIAHSLSDTAATTAHTAYMRWQTANDNRNFLRQTHRSSAVYLLGAGAINAADIIPDGQSTPAVAGITLAYMAVSSWSNISGFRRYLGTRPVFESFNAYAGEQLSRQVSVDVHGMLCPGAAEE
ncbi:MAG TPA: hypothetical protein VK978_03630 [Candidatus Saccharimonadales bacterium]|nr:hypothetical protein [Candidatus Saccharimonadales bacterium]